MMQILFQFVLNLQRNFLDCTTTTTPFIMGKKTILKKKNLQQKLLDWKWPLLSKNWRFENFTKALTPCCQCCQCVSYEVTEGRYQCVCLLYAGRFPIITNIGLWTLLTDIVPHAMQRVVLFVRWQNKKNLQLTLFLRFMINSQISRYVIDPWPI